MSTIAVLPVKRFDDAKQRLGEALRAGTRRALAEAMLTDVLTEDPQMPLERARSEVWDSVAGELGLPAATA